MAIEQELVVQEIALATVAAVDKFVDALMDLRDLQEWRTNAADSAGDPIDFTDYESGNDDSNTELYGENSSNTQLQHIDGSMLNKILGAILGGDDSVTDCVLHHLVNTTVSGGPLNTRTFWEVIQMVRRND